MNNSSIGIFDSGLGGLSVWKEIVRALPEESIMYYGDGANCPYGGKSQAEIIRLSEAIVRSLLDRGAKLIVAACNTATAGAISYLREHYAVPFVGMEPAVKPAAEHSETGVIAILATAGTLKGKLFTETSQRFSAGVKILTRIGEGFVELIETGRANSPEAEEAVRRTVEPLLAQGVDRLVLGCTHYPFLAETLRRVIGDRPVELIDPAPAIARRVKEVLTERNELAEAGHLAKYDYFSSGDEAYRGRLQEYGEKLLLEMKEENEHGKK